MNKIVSTVSAVVVLAIAVGGCASRAQLDRPEAKSSESAAVGTLKSASGAAVSPAQTTELRSISRPSTGQAFPAENASFEPITSPISGLIDATTAEKGIAGGLSNVAASLSGPVTATLYAYSNSAYGKIADDGTVALRYQSTPVWLFEAPLSKELDDVQGAVGGAPRPLTGTGCALRYVVDAEKATVLTWWQQCTSEATH